MAHRQRKGKKLASSDELLTISVPGIEATGVAPSGGDLGTTIVQDKVKLEKKRASSQKKPRNDQEFLSPTKNVATAARIVPSPISWSYQSAQSCTAPTTKPRALTMTTQNTCASATVSVPSAPQRSRKMNFSKIHAMFGFVLLLICAYKTYNDSMLESTRVLASEISYVANLLYSFFGFCFVFAWVIVGIVQLFSFISDDSLKSVIPILPLLLSVFGLIISATLVFHLIDLEQSQHVLAIKDLMRANKEIDVSKALQGEKTDHFYFFCGLENHKSDSTKIRDMLKVSEPTGTTLLVQGPPYCGKSAAIRSALEGSYYMYLSLHYESFDSMKDFVQMVDQETFSDILSKRYGASVIRKFKRFFKFVFHNTKHRRDDTDLSESEDEFKQWLSDVSVALEQMKAARTVPGGKNKKKTAEGGTDETKPPLIGLPVIYIEDFHLLVNTMQENGAASNEHLILNTFIAWIQKITIGKKLAHVVLSGSDSAGIMNFIHHFGPTLRMYPMGYMGKSCILNYINRAKNEYCNQQKMISPPPDTRVKQSYYFWYGRFFARSYHDEDELKPVTIPDRLCEHLCNLTNENLSLIYDVLGGPSYPDLKTLLYLLRTGHSLEYSLQDMVKAPKFTIWQTLLNGGVLCPTDDTKKICCSDKQMFRTMFLLRDREIVPYNELLNPKRLSTKELDALLHAGLIALRIGPSPDVNIKSSANRVYITYAQPIHRKVFAEIIEDIEKHWDVINIQLQWH